MGGQKRREDLLTEIMETSLLGQKWDLSKYRAKIKQHVTPSQGLLDRYTTRFLMGKAADVKIEDLLAELEKS